MRVVFLGNDARSVSSLEALAASSHEVALVVTRVPRPAGRGGRLTPTPVAAAARRLGLPLIETETVKRGPGFDALRGAAPEILVVVAYGEILPRDVLDIPSVAPVNVHFSLLPKLRGADPVRRAILEGHPTTGVTTIRMDEGMDTGDVLAGVEEEIRPDDDGGTLGERLAGLGGRVLVETLDRLAAGTITPRPQDHAAASLAPKLTSDDEWIDWAQPAGAVLRRVRALAPDPGARTRFRGKLLKVLRARPADATGEPGSIEGVTEEGIIVATAQGGTELLEVVPEGRKRQTGAGFARGARPEPGERLTA